jgi:hypothetical protein
MSEPLEPGYDPETLRESYPDTDAVAARIAQLRTDVRDAPDEVAELMARGELVVLLRAGDELDEALNEANAAVDRAEIAGTLVHQHTARVRLAQVHAARGEFAESNMLFTELTAVAATFGPAVSSFTHQHAGENDFDQQLWSSAKNHFALAGALREEFELPDQDVSRAALDAVNRRRAGS